MCSLNNKEKSGDGQSAPEKEKSLEITKKTVKAGEGERERGIAAGRESAEMKREKAREMKKARNREDGATEMEKERSRGKKSRERERTQGKEKRHT